MKSKLATMTSMMTRGALAIALVVVCGGFELFRSENEDVIKGNRLLESGSEADLQAAIDAYRRAQRQLPDERGIDLNLGIALGKKGDFKKGAEHLEIAAGSHSPAVRAQALYVAGNLHFRAAEKVKEPKSPDEAKLRMEELAAAMSAYRRSLETQLKHPLETRLGTLTGDTRWNLELTLREMKKDEEKRQQQQQQQQNGQNGQNQQQNGQNGTGQNGQNGQAGGPCDPSKEICGSNPGDALLDALERTEKNLALERARQRPGLRRKPVKDW